MIPKSILYDLKRLNKLQPMYIKSTSEYKLSSSMTYTLDLHCMCIINTFTWKV